METKKLLKWLGGYFYTIIIIMLTLFLSSCSMYNNISDAEYMHRAQIQKEIDVLQADYFYKLDSLYIEYYKENVCNKELK
jgi:hypothetical protein